MIKEIRRYCRDICMMGSHNEVKACPSINCIFYSFRLGKRGKSKLTPLKSIKEFCYECSGYNREEVKKCWATDCPIYIFRFGKNPNLVGKRKLTKGLRNYLEGKGRKASKS